MLEAAPRHWYSSMNYVIRQDGQELAEIQKRFFRPETVITTTEGQTYTIQRLGWGGPFAICQADGTPLAQAQTYWSKSHIDAYYAGQPYRLRPQSQWKSETFLLEHNGEVVGTIRQKNFWGNKVLIDINGLPLPIVLFFFWLVLEDWKRRQATAAAAVAISSSAAASRSGFYS
ncbi:hypothetical protein [Thermogemmatispora sp.]|uniref:hypothetical protein n=1 Tax=Thermogemmatispora sp. TaxID=1968838 RepID=UPI001D76730C|nr:hypothetical protein [Thermogemmatispora sp.]MBX5450646.1 hypothetical protein [Thermogemmatispora sp.]